MIRRLVSAVTLIVVAASCIGCTRQVRLLNDEVPATSHVSSVVLTSGEVIKFNSLGGSIAPGGACVSGTGADGEPVKIPLDDVRYVDVRRADSGATATLLLAFLIGTSVIAFTKIWPLP
jgi:hypothetical protein